MSASPGKWCVSDYMVEQGCRRSMLTGEDSGAGEIPSQMLYGRGAVSSQKLGVFIVTPSFFPSLPLSPPSSPSVSLYHVFFLPLPSIHLLLFFFLSWGPSLKPATGSGGALWPSPQRVRAQPAPNSFRAFWGENRTLVGNESGVEDVYRRRTSLTNHKVDHEFLALSGHAQHHIGCATVT